MSLITNKTCTFPVKTITLGDGDKERKTKECGKPAVRRFLFTQRTAWACREHEGEYEILQSLFQSWTVNFDDEEDKES